MSLRIEQYASLARTQAFLYDLLDPKRRPKTQKEMRQRVQSCLRHWPLLVEGGRPVFSQDSFDLVDGDRTRLTDDDGCN